MIAFLNSQVPNSGADPSHRALRGGARASTMADRATQDFRTYTIGEMSREFNVTFRTLRFYEARGLLQPQRVGSNRIYRSADRTRMQMILKGKQLGFTLTEISDMIAAPASLASRELGLHLELQQITAQLEHLEQQRLHIDEAIAELRAAQNRLSAA